MIEGVGKNAPVTVNENGGKQSALPYRFDLFDPAAMFAMANVLHQGAEKYGEDNWRKLSEREIINHMLSHAYAYLAGDTQDDHLSHMAVRAIMALAVSKQKD